MSDQIIEKKKNMAIVKTVRPRKFPYANSVSTTYHVVETMPNGGLDWESDLNCYNFNKLETIKQLFDLLTGGKNE